MRQALFRTYVQGESLLDRIGRKAYLSESETERVLLQLCEGLAPIHTQGILHRDIKPSNLILQSGSRIRLIDFNAARIFKEHGAKIRHISAPRATSASPNKTGCWT